MDNIFRDQIILITGAAGTIGQELVKQLLPLGPAEIRILDNNESELFFQNEKYLGQNSVTAFLGDVRDMQKISTVTRGVDIVLHCAAYKHVFFSEYNPFESLQTNALGVQNVLQAAIANDVKMVVFTSSDKAVNPTSVMGTSKLMGERLVTAANIVNHNHKQRFSSVRFGNVVGSRGSVYQLFCDQIKEGGPLTVTHPGMTRFIMSVQRAARLVLEGATLARGGEVMVIKMKVISIMDLARAMIDLLAPYHGHDPSGVEIQIIGPKPGEKMYEELMSSEEAGRALELQDMFVIIPAFRGIYHNIDYSYPISTDHKVDRPYISSQEPRMSLEEIKAFLVEASLLPQEVTLAHLNQRSTACVS
jgi:FlaA1/EpsC-like NDP-sugar epimerase